MADPDKQPVTVTGYSCGCFSGMADRCGRSVVPLPNLPRQFMNLLEGFMGRLPPLAAYLGTAR
jgi:hypothetical protein